MKQFANYSHMKWHIQVHIKKLYLNGNTTPKLLIANMVDEYVMS